MEGVEVFLKKAFLVFRRKILFVELKVSFSYF